MYFQYICEYMYFQYICKYMYMIKLYTIIILQKNALILIPFILKEIINPDAYYFENSLIFFPLYEMTL